MSNNKQPIFCFEILLKKKGYFYIHQKTLDEIRYGVMNGKMVFAPKQVAFEQLLEKEGLVLVKLSSELSVIKKV